MAGNFKACAVDGCNKNAHWSAKGGRGWCPAHYNRWRRNGSPEAGRITPGTTAAWLQEHAAYEGSECLIWPFADGGNGYGALYFRGARTSASRAMCIVAHGEPPSNRHEAAHICGQGHKGCTNPNHLKWSTKLENEADKAVHGTLLLGEKANPAKLTLDQVTAIRDLAGKLPQDAIAERFGVTRSTIGYIHRGDTWT